MFVILIIYLLSVIKMTWISTHLNKVCVRWIKNIQQKKNDTCRCNKESADKVKLDWMHNINVSQLAANLFHSPSPSSQATSFSSMMSPSAIYQTIYLWIHTFPTACKTTLIFRYHNRETGSSNHVCLMLFYRIIRLETEATS